MPGAGQDGDETMRVLLVEDDRMIGAAVVEALRDAAYAVDWVRDGASPSRPAAARPTTSRCSTSDFP